MLWIDRSMPPPNRSPATCHRGDLSRYAPCGGALGTEARRDWAEVNVHTQKAAEHARCSVIASDHVAPADVRRPCPDSSVLRPPANRGFLQGYPGIPPSETRPPAHLSGTIEVQASTKPIEAAWLRVEMAKTETLPSGESWTELIGQGPMDVWAAEGGAHVDGEAWAQLPGVRPTAPLTQRSFPFRVPIPEKLPATLRLEKNGGIRYELIATLCVRVKKYVALLGSHHPGASCAAPRSSAP